MKSRSVAGFGLLQVMIGTVVLGIFAMVFVRKAQNRADVSLLTELITYRDQVLDYYSAVVQSRTAWQCTRKCGSPTTANQGFNLYDGDGECQSGCPTTKTLRLPSQGWRFSNKVAFNPPSAFPSPPGDTDNPFFVQATWQKETVPTGTNSVKVTLTVNFSPSTDWKKDYTTMDIGDRKRVFYMNRTPYKNCSDGLATRFGQGKFFDDGGTGTGVERYAGDTAVVEIDATTGLVKCWRSPLVIPPCYETNKKPFRPLSATPLGVTFTAANACSDADQGLCPKIGLGTTGITHFDSRTGISHCGTEHILMVEKNGDSGVDCGTTGRGKGGLVRVLADGSFVCSNDSGGGQGTGVAHNAGNEYEGGIKGWDGSGNVYPANVNVPYRSGEHARLHLTGTGYYWTGDQGDTGADGQDIECCDCCRYDRLCVNSWPSQCCQNQGSDCRGTNITRGDGNSVNECADCDQVIANCSACATLVANRCETPCRNCKTEQVRCKKPCEDCEAAKTLCEKPCRDCEAAKTLCEKPCSDCRSNCYSNCNSCESTNCSSLSGDRRTECISNHCNSDCNTCLPTCDTADKCDKDCGSCSGADKCDKDCGSCSGADKCGKDCSLSEISVSGVSSCVAVCDSTCDDPLTANGASCKDRNTTPHIGGASNSYSSGDYSFGICTSAVKSRHCTDCRVCEGLVRDCNNRKAWASQWDSENTRLTDNSRTCVDVP